MGLKDWLKNGWIVEHESSPQETQDLLKAADRDLATCQMARMDPDWKLNIAFSSALHSATAALATTGYRAARDSRNFRIIQSLTYTIRVEPALIKQFDQFRKKRNLGTYEVAGAVSDQEANEMVALAVGLRRTVEDWLRNKHPALVKK